MAKKKRRSKKRNAPVGRVAKLLEERPHTIKLTQTLAYEILECQTGMQRKLNRARVDRYAAMMTEGRWRFNGDAIRFAENGKLIDGQHRCMAVFESGITIKVILATGLKESCYHTIDVQGKSRTFADSLQHDGYQNCFVLASATSLLWQYNKGSIATGKYYQPSFEQLLELVKENPGLQDSMRRASIAKRVLTHSAGTVCHYLFRDYEPAMADLFFEQLGTGAELPQRDPVLYLRNSLIRRKVKKGDRRGTGYQVADTILAWNYRRAGKKMSPAWRQRDGSEAFPRPK